MGSDQVSFEVKASKAAGEPEELFEEAWALLADTIRKNARHPSAREVLADYLPETRSDSAGGATAKEIAFESLDLSQTALTRLPERAPALPKLRLLSLAGTKLTRLPAWLAKLPALESVNLWGAPLEPGQLDALRAARPTLQVGT